MNRRLFFAAASAAAVYPGVMGCRAQPGPPSLPEPPPAIGATGDPEFNAWIRDFYRRALAEGIPQNVLDRELAGVGPNTRIIELDRNQPEFSRPASDYIRGAVSETRVSTGRERRGEMAWLSGIETEFGVPGEILIAIWGMESAFGQVQGDFDVIRTLASLAADGRRRELFEANLIAALRMIATGEATRAQMVGSAAGAMGQTQFMPEAFLSIAVDRDGDGRRDLWGSTRDALASAANLLSGAGWRRGESWQREVRLPEGFDYSIVEGPRLPPAAWTMMGVQPADRAGFGAADAASEAQLIAPAGAAGPAFLIFPNHFVIRRYNNSTSYALGVGLLASRIAGDPGVIQPWPDETGLSIAQREGAQRALAALGFDPGGVDGIIGVNTRASIRQYQAARGLPADGYLTAQLAQRLMEEAGLGAGVSAAPPF
jgi:membrane-bound lytic murein transglycosylase B